MMLDDASKVVVELDNTNRIWNLDIFTEVLTLFIEKSVIVSGDRRYTII